MTLAGGYAVKVEDTVTIHTNTAKAAERMHEKLREEYVAINTFFEKKWNEFSDVAKQVGAALEERWFALSGHRRLRDLHVYRSESTR